MQEIEKRRKFFFAELESDVYDVSIGMTTPLYDLMHETLLHLANAHLSKYDQNQELLVLDIGSGTGAESVVLMEKFPTMKVVAVDLCGPMHDQFRCKMKKSGISPDRVCFITGDIIGKECSPKAIQQEMRGFTTKKTFHLGISALTLHHLNTDEKSLASNRIATLLKSGGLFLNADFFTYETADVAVQAHQYGIDWIYKQFTKPDEEYVETYNALGDRAAHLRERWVRHYTEDNKPDPIYEYENPTFTRAQASILHKVGFSKVECPFRFWELGITWAKK